MKPGLTFWQNIPSIHQAPLIRVVAEKWPGTVIVVAENDVSRERTGQGWVRPDFSPARLVVAPSDGERWDLLKKGEKDALHVFSGFHAYPTVYDAFKRAMALGLDVGVFGEPGRTDGVRGILRRSRYAFHGVRWGRRLTFLLATGEMGVRYYRACGFPTDRIFPFAYFVEDTGAGASQVAAEKLPLPRASGMSLLFVGQLIPGRLSTFSSPHCGMFEIRTGSLMSWETVRNVGSWKKGLRISDFLTE